MTIFFHVTKKAIHYRVDKWAKTVWLKNIKNVHDRIEMRTWSIFLWNSSIIKSSLEKPISFPSQLDEIYGCRFSGYVFHGLFFFIPLAPNLESHLLWEKFSTRVIKTLVKLYFGREARFEYPKIKDVLGNIRKTFIWQYYLLLDELCVPFVFTPRLLPLFM